MPPRTRLLSLLALLPALASSACSTGQRVVAEAGPFTIVREQHSFSNWNTGGSTTYFTYQIRYRERDFVFPDVRIPDYPEKFTADDIDRAYVISTSPAALLVLAGDPNNHATWSLLLDTPAGLRAEHVARYEMWRGFAWLDGEAPARIEDVRDRLRLEDGRWLWVDEQALIDRRGLRVLRQSVPERSGDAAKFVAFSPDRGRMVRFTTVSDRGDWRRTHPVLLVNDVESGAHARLDIDPAVMWFDDDRDVDREFVAAYFGWREVDGRGYVLERLGAPRPRPYRGRLSREPGSTALEYSVPRLAFEQRRAAMDLIAAALGGTYSMDAPDAASAPPPPPPPPPPPATSSPDDGSAVAAAASAPSMSGPLAKADLAVEGSTLAIYFSDRGLSVTGTDPAQHRFVERIAAAVDARLASPDGHRLLTAKTP